MSAKETTHYARLCHHLVDVGSQVLRSTFDKIHPPTTLHRVLGSHLTALSLIAITEKEENAESHEMGEVVSLSLIRVICDLRNHAPNNATQIHPWFEPSCHWLGSSSLSYKHKHRR